MGSVVFDPDAGGDDYYIEEPTERTWISLPGRDGTVSLSILAYVAGEGDEPDTVLVEAFRRGEECEAPIADFCIAIPKERKR